MKIGYLGILSPLLHVLDDDMLKVVRSTWKNPKLELPGFQILYTGQSDAPIWGADSENFGRVAIMEVSAEDSKGQLSLHRHGDTAAKPRFSEEVALAFLLAILTTADSNAGRKFSTVAFYAEPEFANHLPTTWVTPRFVWLRIFGDGEEADLSAEYLFDSDAYPEFEEAWVEDPLSFLHELSIAASDFLEESEGLFDAEGLYIGEKVQPSWMSQFKPKN